MHPLVRQAETKFLQRGRGAARTVVVLDIPLLFETGGEQRVDAVVVVSAPAGDAARARARRAGMTMERLEALLARQMPDAEKRRRADFVVDTSRGLRRARALRCVRFLRRLLQMPKRRR